MLIKNENGHDDFQKHKVHCRKEKEQVKCCFFFHGATMFDIFKDRKQSSGNRIEDTGKKVFSVFKELMN